MYHGSEEQGHQQRPCHQEEDDEDADDLIQGAFQPDDHLEGGEGDRDGEWQELL